MVHLGNAILSNFFLSNARIIIFFFNVTVVFGEKPSYFFLSFSFWHSLKYFIYFCSLVYLSFSDQNIVLLFPVYYLAVFMDKYSVLFFLL